MLDRSSCPQQHSPLIRKRCPGGKRPLSSDVCFYCKVYNSMTQSKKLIKAIVLGTKSDPSSDWVVTDHSSVHLLWSVLGYWTSPTLWIKLNYDKYLNYVSNLVALINQTLNFPLIFFFRKKYLIMNCKIYYQYQCLIYVVNRHHISNINQNTAKPTPYQCNVLLNVEMLKWLLITLPSMLRCWHK